MAFEEKRAWIMLGVTVVGYVTYVSLVLGRMDSGSLTDAPYIATMLATIGGAIAVAILVQIAVAAAVPEEANQKDQRDQEIARAGDHIGQWFVVVGAVSALLLAMAEVDYFWIANAVYLAFVLSALLSSAAKILAYRKGFQSW